MRISTSMIYDSGLAAMQNRTGTLLTTQQQLSTGRRMLTPSDDPVAAARALEVTQSQSVNASQATTRDNVKSMLGITDSQLDSATDLMTRVRELTVQAGNAALSSADRRSTATELRARFDEMVGLANSRDGTGQYLFGGYQTNSQPFAGSVESGVVYGGDDGARTLRVSGSRELAISNSGNDVFMRIKNGNGVFATGTQYEKSANLHSVSIDAGTIANVTAWNAITTPANLEVRFWTDAAGGGVATKGYAAGSVAAPATISAGVNDTFDISVNGAAAVTVPLTVGAFSTGQLQLDIDAVLGAGVATASVDANNQLVITSNTVPTSTATASSVALTASGGDTGQFASLFGATPSQTNGVYSIPGQTFYDLVDTGTDPDQSVFTGGASTAGASGTYTRPYTSGANIPLASSGPAGSTVFDYGATVVVSGNPMTGDKFSIDRPTGGGIKTSPASIGHVNAMIDRGSVSDPMKWAASANGQDMEVRFWVDATNLMGGGAGATYYDLVDAASGDSLFNGTPSVSGAAGTYTHRYASTHATLTGTVDLTVPANRTIGLGVNDTLNLTVDGVARSVTIDPAAYATPQLLVANIQAKFAAAVPPIAVTASLNGAGTNLVLMSDSVAGTSSVAVTAPASNAATALLGGAPVSGYANEYASSATINLKSLTTDAQIFDFGASVVISGSPVNGDTFTIKGSTDPVTSNGFFATEAKTATVVNTGSGIIGAGEVLDETKWNGPLNSRNLEVRFWQDPLVTAPNGLYYDLVDKETGKSLFTATNSASGGSNNTFTHAFKAGDSIKFSALHANYSSSGGAGDFGISVTIQGTPASGDTFKIQPSESESVFETLGRLITTLESGAPIGTSGNTHLSNELGDVLTSIASIDENLLRVRASIGSRLAEVDDLDTVGGNLDLQYSETLSRLQDLDYADAITRLTRQQMELQASQQSFSRISQLSLFQYL